MVITIVAFLTTIDNAIVNMAALAVEPAAGPAAGAG